MFAYCPKCGSNSISSANHLEFNCSSCGLVYYHNMASSVAAILSWGNKILFTVREKDPGAGLLDLPGGFVDHRESLEEALTRELFEELGLSIDIDEWQYFCSAPNVYQYGGVTYHTCDSIFIKCLDSKPALQLETTEITQALWILKDSIDLEKIAFPSLRFAVKKLVNQKE